MCEARKHPLHHEGPSGRGLNKTGKQTETQTDQETDRKRPGEQTGTRACPEIAGKDNQNIRKDKKYGTVSE